MLCLNIGLISRISFFGAELNKGGLYKLMVADTAICFPPFWFEGLHLGEGPLLTYIMMSRLSGGVCMYSEEQQKFIDIVKDFYFNQIPRRDYLVLAGLPGVGKTYIVSKIQEELGIGEDCVYAVRTGKAATVLQSKGVKCVTIHRLIYDLEDSKNLLFRRKEELDRDYKLIIIDEFSTVDDAMIDDLVSYRIPIIMVGDANQLPPIGKETYYLKNPDFILTEIVRQKKDSLIVKLARGILKGKLPKYGVYGEEGNKISIIHRDELTYDIMSSADQIICGTNKTREEVNKIFRKKCKHFDYLPEVGEKIIITKNCWNDIVGDMPIINGTTGIVKKIKDTPNDYCIILFQPDYTTESKALRVDKSFFLGKTPNKNSEYVTCEWGYCITVHKAQGSEYNKVVFIADKMPKDIFIRFLNTGVTRAKEEVVLVI